MAGLFDKIKKDVKRGIEEGISVVKEGASTVSEKVGELTAEGKRQYKMYDLKAKIQGQMTMLGGRVYDVLDGKRSPAADSKVKEVFVKIKNLEGQLSKLEGKKKTKAAAPVKPEKKTKETPKITVQAKIKKPSVKAAKKPPAKK
ncbi:hypothetical protein D4R89_03620 [bacterium]|nr:MAG: hypothetical protein D4R89_03620 [bacterium]